MLSNKPETKQLLSRFKKSSMHLHEKEKRQDTPAKDRRAIDKSKHFSPLRDDNIEKELNYLKVERKLNELLAENDKLKEAN
jgi:hypothetical protein